MNVDLVVPRIPTAHWNFASAMDLVGARFSHPPLSVAALAAHTPAGVNVRILDENVEDVDPGALADVVGLSAMFIQRERTFELARILRAAGKKVLIGGSLVTALPRQCAREADVVFRGEAELTWPAFLQDLGRGSVRPLYEPLERFDLTRSRTPRFDLLKMDRYSTASVQTSRGCPFACDFCDVSIVDGPVARTKTVDQVMVEIETVWSMGQRSCFIVDDNFTANRPFAMALLAEMARFAHRHHHKPIFYCQATLNVAKDDEMLEALYQANFRRLFLGIETHDLEALRGVNKHQNTQLPVVEAVQRIQRYNITVWCALLAGFDDDTPEVFRQYRDLAQEAKIGMVIPGLLQALPDTPLLRRLQGQGRIIPLRNGYVAGQAGSLDTLPITNIVPRRMPMEALVAGYKRLCRELYEYDAFADRLIGFLSLGEKVELGKVDLRDVWDAKGILARLTQYYMVDGDDDRRRFFGKIMAFLAGTGFRRLDEALFHLVIYKHLREFYFAAHDGRVPVAEDVLPA